MVYYEENDIVIRNLERGDAQTITDEEARQGWDAAVEKHYMRLQDQAQGKAVPLAAEYRGCVAGYVNIYPNSMRGAFGGKGYTEIVDFAVLEKYRGRGIGGRLMDTAEMLAAEYAPVVYLGVGLHSGYGSAQRIYIKRGYVPDGSGVWYGDAVCQRNAGCRNDDNLILYLSKRL